MRCGACGSDNRPGRRFCSGCGGPLGAACSACGFENDAADRFCGGCGAVLAPPVAPAARENAPELRPVAVLFADLSGFTSLAGRMDPDDARELLNGVFALADEAVVGAGGRVDKHIGDGVMAVFGAPVAHGDDPQRAASAALDIRARIKAFAERNGHPGLAVHSGIAAGLVFAAETGSSLHSAYTMTGQPVNLAARLCDLAVSGEILVSSEIADAAGDSFQLDPRGSHAIAGFEEPVPVWSLSGPRAASNEERRLPIVGRDRELRQVLASLDSCVESRRGQIVHLRGEAGIGKSRLSDEILHIAQGRGFTAVRVANPSFGSGEERHVARMLLARLVGVEGEPDAAALSSALVGMLRSGRIEAVYEGIAYDLAGLPVPAPVSSLFAALDAEGRRLGRERLLASLAAARAAATPLMLIVEDLHWAEREMVDVAAAIALAVRDLPVVLVLTSRREGNPIDAAWRSRIADTPVATLDLAPLAAADAEKLVRGVMALQGDVAVAGVVARAGGNPLFLIQLLHHIAGAREGTLPTSIRSLIVARLDRLAERERAALQAASALGQRFGEPELAHLLGRADCDCRPLIAAFLLRPSESAFEFVHALVRDAVYDTLPKARRRELHGRAAAWFETRDRLLFAQHLDQAADARAALAFQAAAQASFAALRHDEAARHNARGLEIAQAPGDRRALLAQRAEISFERGDIGASLADWQEALAIGEADPPSVVRALIGLAQCHRIIDRFAEAEEALGRAEALALAHGLTLERSQIRFLRGNLLFPQGRVEGCEVEHRSALELAREARSAEAEARALGGLGDAYYALGRMESAHAAFAGCVTLAREHGLGRIELANLPMAGFTAFFSGRIEEAERMIVETVEMSRKAGLIRSEMIGCHGVFWIAIERDEMARARRAVERAEEIASSLGALRFQAENLAFLAQASLIEGDRPKALELARSAWRLAEETGPAYIGAVALAEVAAAAPEEAEWREATARGEALLAAGVLSHNYFIFYRRMMEVGLERGAHSDVERWADALERRFEEEPGAWTRFFSAWGRTLAAWERGERGATRERLRAIVAEARALQFKRAADVAERRLRLDAGVAMGTP